MNELESLLNYLETTSLEPHDDYTSEFSYKEQKKLWRYIKGLQQENKELKTLNKRYEEIISDDKENYELLRAEIKQLENQQKEFIEYLEKERKRLEEKNIYEPLQIMAIETLKHILSKYKEIIGIK